MAGKKRVLPSAGDGAAASPSKRRSGRLVHQQTLVKDEVVVKTEVKLEGDMGLQVKEEAVSMLLKSTASEPSPFAGSVRPTAEECIAARDALAALHGEPIR